MSGGVQFGFLDDNRMVEFGVKILRPHVTDQQCQTAIDFAKSQLGKPYSYAFDERRTSASTPEWYCSELIYAAYYNAGISLILYKLANGNNSVPAEGALPIDLYNGMHSHCVCIENENYVDIELVHGDRWQVRIYNKSDTARLILYSNKMCVQTNAKNWTNLSNLSTVNIPANSYATVTISEKFLCGYIAVSYHTNGHRYITYANGLQAGPYKMAIYYNVI